MFLKSVLIFVIVIIWSGSVDAGCKYTNPMWIISDPNFLSAPTIHLTFNGVNEEDQVWLKASWNLSYVEKYPQCIDSVQILVKKIKDTKTKKTLLCDLQKINPSTTTNCTGHLSRKDFCDETLDIWIRITNNDYKDGLQPIGAPSMTRISNFQCGEPYSSDPLGTYMASQSCESLQPAWSGPPDFIIPDGIRSKRVVNMTWSNKLIDNVVCVDEVEIKYWKEGEFSKGYHKESVKISNAGDDDFVYNLELDVNVCTTYSYMMKAMKTEPYFVANFEGKFASKCDESLAGQSSLATLATRKIKTTTTTTTTESADEVDEASSADDAKEDEATSSAANEVTSAAAAEEDHKMTEASASEVEANHGETTLGEHPDDAGLHESVRSNVEAAAKAETASIETTAAEAGTTSADTTAAETGSTAAETETTAGKTETTADETETTAGETGSTMADTGSTTGEAESTAAETGTTSGETGSTAAEAGSTADATETETSSDHSTMTTGQQTTEAGNSEKKNEDTEAMDNRHGHETGSGTGQEEAELGSGSGDGKSWSRIDSMHKDLEVSHTIEINSNDTSSSLEMKKTGRILMEDSSHQDDPEEVSRHGNPDQARALQLNPFAKNSASHHYFSIPFSLIAATFSLHLLHRH